MTELLRSHGDHGDATAVTAVQAPRWHRTSGVTGVLHPANITISGYSLLFIHSAGMFTDSCINYILFISHISNSVLSSTYLYKETGIDKFIYREAFVSTNSSTEADVEHTKLS